MRRVWWRGRKGYGGKVRELGRWRVMRRRRGETGSVVRG